MKVVAADIIEAIESGSFLFPDIPGKVRRLPIDRIYGYDTSVSHPYTNMIGLSELEKTRADDTIANVFEFYQQRSFGWLVGPTSTPTDLGERLEKGGMQKVVELYGMVRDSMELDHPINPAVQVRESCPGDFDLAVSLMSKAYPMQADACDIYTTAYLRKAREQLRTRVYFGYLEPYPEPVAISYSVFFEKYPIILLAGAATLPDFRGNGIYSAMVKRRLDDAAQAKMQYAVIQAVKNTSAPICRALGFREVCELAMFISDPQDVLGIKAGVE